MAHGVPLPEERRFHHGGQLRLVWVYHGFKMNNQEDNHGYGPLMRPNKVETSASTTQNTNHIQKTRLALGTNLLCSQASSTTKMLELFEILVRNMK